ncbi:PRC-barrel domain-containing protein [Bacillus sp. YZJH907-2]|uniref:PRC-barrel domain-containing protein n=1 Tax=Halalkalibacter suaedae TaxID=2822140 RepID=A0A940WVW3_9BACI|nr:PRC-barrel domain-containing protein [Bacillus suaedae]
MKDLYFDSEKWVVRYLVIDTLKWLPGLQVLVSPVSFDNVELADKRISILATRLQIEKSPSIEEHRPLSRQMETDLHTYYGWTPYWIGEGLWGNGDRPTTSQTKPTENELNEQERPFLRNVNELKGQWTGYTVNGLDQKIGNVVDFVFDDDSWAVHYLIVDTGDWLPGRKVMLPPEAIVSINWATKEISTNLTSEDAKVEATERNSILHLDEISIDNLRRRSITNK